MCHIMKQIHHNLFLLINLHILDQILNSAKIKSIQIHCMMNFTLNLFKNLFINNKFNSNLKRQINLILLDNSFLYCIFPT